MCVDCKRLEQQNAVQDFPNTEINIWCPQNEQVSEQANEWGRNLHPGET